MSDTETIPTVPEPAQAEPDSLYRYSAWVHVGVGAAECEWVDEPAGTVQPDMQGCDGHFHAWCRIPNEFQRREIAEHAKAAAARKRRQMRRDGTTAFEMLEEGLDSLVASAAGMERARNELMGEGWFQAFQDAQREVRDMDDPHSEGEEPEKLYANIDTDVARFQRLVSEGSVESDEFVELQDHVAGFELKLQEQVEALLKPERDRLEGMDDLDVIAELRNARIERAGQEEFIHHFNAHTWLSCTFPQRAGEPDPAFRDLKQLERAAPEVLAALRSTFDGLQATAQRAAGN